MRAGSVAKRYAVALVQVAQEEGKVQDYLAELERLVSVIQGYADLQALLDSPVVKPSQKKEIFKALQAKLNLSPTLLRLVFVLMDHDRTQSLPMVVRIYQEMADDILGQVRAQVVAAAPLGAQEDKLKGLLEKRLKKKVLLETKVQPEILGGLIIRVKDLIFDGSLTRELRRVRDAIVRRAVA